MTYQPTMEQLELEAVIDALAQKYYKKHQEAVANMLVAQTLGHKDRIKVWQAIAEVSLQAHINIKGLLER